MYYYISFKILCCQLLSFAFWLRNTELWSWGVASNFAIDILVVLSNQCVQVVTVFVLCSLWFPKQTLTQSSNTHQTPSTHTLHMHWNYFRRLLCQHTFLPLQWSSLACNFENQTRSHALSQSCHPLLNWFITSTVCHWQGETSPVQPRCEWDWTRLW